MFIDVSVPKFYRIRRTRIALLEQNETLNRVHTLRKLSFIVVVVQFLWVEGHWDSIAACACLCHFNEYDDCRVHFQFPTSTNSPSNYIVINLEKSYQKLEILHFLVNYCFSLHCINEMFEINHLLSSLKGVLNLRQYRFRTRILVQWLAKLCHVTNPIWSRIDGLAGPKILIVGLSFVKGELQRENKLISCERAFKMLENDISLSSVKPFLSC